MSGTERTLRWAEGRLGLWAQLCVHSASLHLRKAFTSLFRRAILSTRNVGTKHGNHLGTDGTTSIPEQVHISDFYVRPYTTCSFWFSCQQNDLHHSSMPSCRGKSDLFHSGSLLFTALPHIASFISFRLFLSQNLANVIQDISHNGHGKISFGVCYGWQLRSIHRYITHYESILDIAFKTRQISTLNYKINGGEWSKTFSKNRICYVLVFKFTNSISKIINTTANVWKWHYFLPS